MPLIVESDKAKELAERVAMDVALYNQETIIKQYHTGNVLKILQKEIEEGRMIFNSRVDPELLDKNNFFDVAIAEAFAKAANK
jgi:hypothetical protein